MKNEKMNKNREKTCDHQLGLYGDISLFKHNMEEVKMTLERKILEFNSSKKAIPHPGWIIFFKFCPLCGEENLTE